MTIKLWQMLPENFLKMKFPRWQKLGLGVQRLIVELAQKQEFSCAICKNRKRGLVVDHDHEPEEGPGDILTIYNIRGLVCQGCNWDLGFYEKEQSGEPFGWENVDCKLSERDYDTYTYAYLCRAGALREALLEKRIPNYWYRRQVLERFDDWYYEGGQPPFWYRKYQEQKRMKIETPEDFIRDLTAILRFVKDQARIDPNYEPPEEFWKLMARIRPIFDDALKKLIERRKGSALSHNTGHS